MQRKSEKTIQSYLDPRDPVDSVIVMIEPGTGMIVAMAQNRNKMGTKRGETFWNYAVDRKMGGGNGYQGGSTFKMFVAAAALKNGLGAYGQINVQSRMNFRGYRFQSCDGPFTLNQDWNVVGGSGRHNLFTGTTSSVNGYFAQLESAANLCDATKIAQQLGLKVADDPKGDYLTRVSSWRPAFTLGAVEVSPISLVNAYATVAARGIHCEPIIIKSMKAADGTNLEAPSANCKRVMDEGIADALSKIFQGPFRSGTARWAAIPGYTVAGKTGTVADDKAIWTVGFTRNLAGGGMISYSSDPRFRSFWKSRGLSIKGAYMKHSQRRIQGNSGLEAGGRIFKPAFAAALKNYDRKGFVEPPYGVLAGKKVGIPSCSGAGVEGCRAILMRAGFGAYTDFIASNSPKGTFLGTSPRGVAVRGTSIRILISSGPAPKPKPTKKDEDDKKPSATASASPKPKPSPTG